MSLANLKGKRTRYRNYIEKELTEIRNLLAVETGSIDIQDFINEIDCYINKLTELSEKLDTACADLSIEARNQDRDQDYEQFIEEDNKFAITIIDYIGELERRKREAKELIVTGTKYADSTLAEQVVQLQTQLNQLMLQNEQQQEGVGTRGSQHSSVNLPKLELPSFNGDKLKWSEFWDTFEATVERNNGLSNIEKLSYLNSKLTGEAKQAVSGIHLSNENYEVTKTLLKDRFGSSQSVVNSHYTQLINMKPAHNSTKGLRNLQDQFERHLRSLEALKQDTNQDVFINIMTSKIPKDVLLHLQIQRGAKVKWTVSQLRELLSDYISVREETEEQCNTETAGSNPEVTRPIRSSAEALVVGSRSPRQGNCRFCNGQHWSDECQRYLTAEDRKQRIKGSCFICMKPGHRAADCGIKKSCCYCHQWNNHHRSLCQQQFGTGNREAAHLVQELPAVEEARIEENALLSSGEMVLMQTATADISNPGNGQKESVRMLFDTGSHRTYISEALANKLNLKRGEESEINLVTFGSEKPKTHRTAETTIGIMLRGGSTMNINANVVPSITGSILRRPVQCKSIQNWEHLWNKENLADSFPTEKEETTIDLLIGNDYYLDFILPQRVEVQPGLYMLASKLGWILTGRTTEAAEETTECNMLIMTHSTNVVKKTELLIPDRSFPIKPNLEDFWRLESIGIVDSPVDSDRDEALKIFNKSLKFEDNRYKVTWPWKEDKSCLPENRELAFGRLKSLVNKMKNNPELVDKYDAVIEKQLQLGVIERVTNNRKDTAKHYIPHHAVIKPDKTTTKVRVVYDASAKTNKGQKSLNECLYPGPTMLKDLTGILLRFRLHKIAIVADIEKAFLQIGLLEDAKDMTRFFWLKNKSRLNVENNVQVYRFNRVPFGIISSPFLLAATLDHHLKGYKNAAAETIRENIYVDNVITGKETIEETVDFYTEAKQIFEEASMNLRDWMSSEESVMKKIPTNDRANKGPMKILGLTWIPESDMIGLNSLEHRPSPATLNMTKRLALRQVSSVYDPLGLFSPVTLQGKIFLQALWNEKLAWDDPLAEQEKVKWLNIDADLRKISDCRIPRYIRFPNSEKPNYQLLVFCDASKNAYAATVYLRQQTDSRCISNLIFSKTRLAPNKEISIPRLELLAALIGVRCMKFVERELHIEIQQKHMWLDSKCVLNWIGSTRMFTVFVENRLKEIRDDREINFHYIASTENPADMASRGVHTEQLQRNNLWWYGPEWLLSSSDNWPTWKINNTEDETLTDYSNELSTKKPMYEAKLVAGEGCMKHSDVSTKVSAPLDIDMYRFSSLTKLLRVTALALHFISKLRGTTRSKDHLDSEAIVQAERLWIRYVQQLHYGDVIYAIQNKRHNNMKQQLGIYLDSESILRCRGRLTHAELAEAARLPILLPKLNKYTSLLIEKVHRNSLHVGVSQTLSLVRQNYWIPQGRSAVKGVLLKCSVCRHYDGGPYSMPSMPPLPTNRVTPSPPFSHSGVDYFGPLFIKSKDETKKVWVCLYTCLATRAIHLELMSDMSTEQFLMGFRRFLSQRGKIKELISDNASHFKLASELIDKVWRQIMTEQDVLSYAANEKIRWKFIVELAPWMGGFYERLIGLVKRSLRKAIGKLCLTYDQLLTILKEVEAIINSRPLVYVEDDMDSNITLTPSHFLTLNPRIGLPACDLDDNDHDFSPNESSAEKLLVKWKKGLKYVDRFWKIWKDEYLMSLRERTQTKLREAKKRSNYPPQIGDVVLIKDDLPRGNWRIGKITELMTSFDEQVRAAKVVLPTKRIISRPLNLLYPIECSKVMDRNQEDDIKSRQQTENDTETPRQRPKREAAQRALKQIKEQID